MTTTVFISYSRADMEVVDWLKRLRMYFAPFGQRGTLDTWDDGRIVPGTLWQAEIEHALEAAGAAVLVVGPGFLASPFVQNHELPRLLDAAAGRGLKLFPLIVGYCAWKAIELGRLQSFNPPDLPLESLVPAQANKVMNEMAIAVDAALRSLVPTTPKAAINTSGAAPTLWQAMRRMSLALGDSRMAFTAQAHRRDTLVAALETRLAFHNELEYERFFLRHHAELDAAERFEFDQIRAMTEGPMHESNRTMLGVLEQHPALLDALPSMTALRQHLVFWLNKYERVFKANPAMCLLYVGVEDGVPFPSDIDGAVKTWLRENAAIGG
ncbi:MAG: toll/interleukin-1 receptor domain-containing protein [Burkholderiales bacterium]